MPLALEFNLREYIEPILRDCLFETVDTIKETISNHLEKILPPNEFLVAITANDSDSLNNGMEGTIYAKFEDDKFKALDFIIQPMPISFDEVLDENFSIDT